MITTHLTLPFQPASEPGTGFYLFWHLVHLVSEPHTSHWKEKLSFTFDPLDPKAELGMCAWVQAGAVT